ncbi:MAG: type II secretion system F family protein [Planctomycetota bacterium]
MIYITTALFFVAGLLMGRSIVSIWDGITKNYIADIKPQLKSLGMDGPAINGWLRAWGISLLATVVVLSALNMIPIAIVVAILLLFVPRLLLAGMIRRRRSLLRDQLVAGTTALANASRAGLSLAQGLTSVAREVPQPLATELASIVSEYEHGRPLASAIRNTRDRLQLDSFTLFASAVCVSLERGGRVTESLDKISRSLRENQRVERKLESETASGKRVVALLAIFPFLFLAGFYVMHPEGTRLVFQSLVGQFVLVAVIGLVVASCYWSNKILSIEL